MAGPSCFHGGTLGWCLLCLTVRNWGHKVQSGLSSASHNTSRVGSNSPQPGSHLPMPEWLRLHVHAHLKQFVSTSAVFKLGSLFYSRYHLNLIWWLGLQTATTSVTRPSSALLPLFVSVCLSLNMAFRFHFRCVLRRWSFWDSYPDAYSCCWGINHCCLQVGRRYCKFTCNPRCGLKRWASMQSRSAGVISCTLYRGSCSTSMCQNVKPRKVDFKIIFFSPY